MKQKPPAGPSRSKLSAPQALAPETLAPETMMMRYGYNPWWSEGAVKPPLFLTSTFLFKSAEDGEEFFQVALGKKESTSTQGLIYSRLNNPELEILEERLKLWESAQKASVFASGMAAITTTFLALCKPGDVVVYTVPVYGGTAHFLKEMLPQFQVRAIPVNAGDSAPAEIAKLLASSEGSKIKVIFVETPSNPSLTNTGIQAVRAEIDRARSGAMLVVDNTMLGPVFQRPIQCGAHLSVYSATKFIGGHSDLIAGAVMGSAELIGEINVYRSFLGTMGSPFVCWQIMRSLETLKIRMESQAARALEVARFLAGHPQVQKVLYPGVVVEASAQARVQNDQITGFGSVMSFEVKGGKKKAFEVLNRVQVAHLAVSLGGTETLIEHPKTMTHSEMDEALMAQCGITDGLIRLSVGLESAEDLIRDLEQALA